MGLFKKKNDAAKENGNLENESVSHLKGDRNDISVSGKSGGGKKKAILIAIFLIFVFMISSLLGFFYLKSENEVAVFDVQASEKEQYKRADSDAAGLDDLKREQARLERSLADMKNDAEEEEETKVANMPAMPVEQPAVSMPVVDMPEKENVDSQGNIIIPPSERRLQGSTLVSVDSISVPQEPMGGASGQGFGSDDSGDFLQGATFADGYVSRLKNRSFLLPAGTAAPCVLKTKIVTSYPGFVMCQLTKNIYSDDGKNILVRAGAEFHGEQTQVMQQGIARVFVNWSTLKDRNMKIRIDALGADGLGAAGLPAWIDNHFWERFGGAIMLSFIDDALAAAASQVTKNNSGNGITFDNSQNAASNMANVALENSINIPPTAIVNQGEMLTVIVPRYIDFSNVYKNR